MKKKQIKINTSNEEQSFILEEDKGILYFWYGYPNRYLGSFITGFIEKPKNSKKYKVRIHKNFSGTEEDIFSEFSTKNECLKWAEEIIKSRLKLILSQIKFKKIKE